MSFTRAAQELNITQTAISHQIKKLEDFLGSPLFFRDGNTIRLTDSAQEYLKASRAAILEVMRASDRIQERADQLTIACPGTFAIKCLIPALREFRTRHPEIALRIRTLAPFETRTPHYCDLAVQYALKPDTMIREIKGHRA